MRTKTDIKRLYRQAHAAGLVSAPDDSAINRAWRAYQKNIDNPGDCAGDDSLLSGLAIGQACIGLRPGWIPEVQKIGCAIAKMIEKDKAQD